MRPVPRLRDLPKSKTTPAPSGPSLEQQLADAQADAKNLEATLQAERAAHDSVRTQLASAQAQHQQDEAHLTDLQAQLTRVTKERDDLLAKSVTSAPAQTVPAPSTSTVPAAAH
jgi:septal ring factor EnvC (AmiA/AmiB activator)